MHLWSIYCITLLSAALCTLQLSLSYQCPLLDCIYEPSTSKSSFYSQCLLIYFFAAYVYAHPVVSYDHRWAEDIGWCVAAAPIIIGLISGALHSYLYMKGTLKEVFIHLNTELWIYITHHAHVMWHYDEY